MTRNHGIDYGLGMTNINKASGIRYGVINMNALSEWAWESFEPDYGDPACPKCGNGVCFYSDVEDDQEYKNYREHSCSDYACAECKVILGSDEVYGDEPNGHTLDDGEYKAFVDSYNDVMVLESPYYTHAQFCSPCAPGAGHLEHPTDKSGVKTYCFGPEWFEGDKAPYPVYLVSTGELVL